MSIKNNIFFYHSDHLCSVSYLTNDAGQVAQTLNHIPYGEDWVDIQHYMGARYSNMELYTFTGKERDDETGYSYFGARYYDADLLTGWMRVDPMADKYPSISPYSYCAWNPEKYIDPNGEEKYIWYKLQNPYSQEHYYRKVTQRKTNPLSHQQALANWDRLVNYYKGNIKLNLMDHNYVNNSSTDHLFCHGTNDQRIYFNDRSMTAKEFSNFLKGRNSKYRNQEKSVLMLHSCNSGNGENSFGKQLSENLTNCIVIAASNNVSYDNDGNEYVADGGRWNVYYNGRLICYTPGSDKWTKWIERLIEDDPQKVYQHYKKYIYEDNN